MKPHEFKAFLDLAKEYNLKTMEISNNYCKVEFAPPVFRFPDPVIPIGAEKGNPTEDQHLFAASEGYPDREDDEND